MTEKARFDEITLKEALEIIGNGNPNKDLYYSDPRDAEPNVYNYEGKDIKASQIRKQVWFRLSMVPINEGEER